MRDRPNFDIHLARCFLRLAEIQHFGWAADELRMAQPTLSRSMQRLETQVGVKLLDRGPKGTSLTRAGALLQARLTTIVDQLDVAVAEARLAGGRDSIVLGYVGDLLITSAARTLRERHPLAEVRTVHLGWREINPSLLRHQVDLVLTRLPFDVEGLDVVPVRRESRVLLVPRHHHLADRQAVRLADFADEPLVRFGDLEYDAFWRVDPRPDGTRAPDGPLVDAYSEKLETIASGLALSLAPAAPGLRAPRQDLVAVPVEDVDDVEVVLATRRGEQMPLVLDVLADDVRDRL